MNNLIYIWLKLQETMEDVKIHHVFKKADSFIPVITPDRLPLSHMETGSVLNNLIYRLNQGAYKSISDVGTLSTTGYKNNKLDAIFETSNYAEYAVTAFPFNPAKNPLGDVLRRMRVSSVGCCLITKNNEIVYQRRPDSLIANGTLDSGASGIVIITYRDILQGSPATPVLDFDASAKAKTQKELGVDPSNLDFVKTAFWSSDGPTNILNNDPKVGGVFLGSYSAMLGYKVETGLTFAQIQTHRKQSNPTLEINCVKMDDLPQFLLENAEGERGFCADGLLALLSALPRREFNDTLRGLNERYENKIST